MNITLESRLAIDPHARFRRVGPEGVVVQQTASEVLVVNDAAATLLELSDGKRTLAECAGLIERDFEAARDAIERDVLSFAGELVAAGVATIV